jgi:hypothetical protein
VHSIPLNDRDDPVSIGDTHYYCKWLLPDSSGTTIRHNTNITQNYTPHSKCSTQNSTYNKGYTTHYEYNAIYSKYKLNTLYTEQQQP